MADGYPADREDSSQTEPEDENDPEAGERRHFLDVCHSLRDYDRDASRDVAHVRNEYSQLAPQDTALCKFDIDKWAKAVEYRITVNSKFLNFLPTPDVCGANLEGKYEQEVYQMPPEHRVASRNSSKVRSTLKQFVRDWAVEGEAERARTYTPIIEALGRHLPPHLGSGRRPKVLCPGSGLGRLCFELASIGYDAQGNEFSYHMILGMHLIFNRTRTEEQYTIYPFALSRGNSKTAEHNLSAYKVPYPCPAQAMPPGSQMSMASGEFVEIYKNQLQEWDGVATAFFLDTAKNVLLYIRTIASMLRSGGVWVNLGPLLYHYADSENEVSIELSWDEVRSIMSDYFEFREEKFCDADYTSNPGALMQTRYRCMLFVAVRNERPVSGKSNPVY